MPVDRGAGPIDRGRTNLGGFVLGTTLGPDLDALRRPGAGSDPDRGRNFARITRTARSCCSLIPVGAALPMLASLTADRRFRTQLRSVAPYAARLQQGFGVIVIAFALSAFLQYDAIALAWLGQFFPEGRIGL